MGGVFRGLRSQIRTNSRKQFWPIFFQKPSWINFILYVAFCLFFAGAAVRATLEVDSLRQGRSIVAALMLGIAAWVEWKRLT
jgi:hypothetical protein